MKKIYTFLLGIFFFGLCCLPLGAVEVSFEQKIELYLEQQKDTDSLEHLNIQLTRIKNKIISQKATIDSHLIVWKISLFQKKILEKIKQIQTNTHLQKIPQNIKAVYYTAYAAGRAEKQKELISLVKNTDINAVVIDIKETDGYTSFSMNPEDFGDIAPESNHRIKDIKKIITSFHENNIYVIGRIVVFKDARLSSIRKDLAIKWSWDHSKIWTDYKGKSYTDPGSQEVWDYHINLASSAYMLGFDEINFDYVRFPSDGRVSQTYYPKSHKKLRQNPSWGKIQTLENFSYYLNTKLKEKHPNIVLSADLFGLATHTNLKQIGQNLEAFIPYSDYVAPMIYPSHYSKGYLGFSVPDNAPYEIFDDSMKRAQKRINALNTQIQNTHDSGSGSIIIADAPASDQHMKQVSLQKIRPWLQAFHCSWCPGASPYTASKFQKQVSALKANNIKSWYVWNASSRYETSWYK